jgi:hypothetical protein
MEQAFFHQLGGGHKELASAVEIDRLVPVFRIYSSPSLEEHLNVEPE